jgi:hypothetical protein
VIRRQRSPTRQQPEVPAGTEVDREGEATGAAPRSSCRVEAPALMNIQRI